MWFYFSLLDCAHFFNEIEKFQLKKSLKYFSILRPIKDNVRLEYLPSKNVWLCFIPMAWVDFTHKIEKF